MGEGVVGDCVGNRVGVKVVGKVVEGRALVGDAVDGIAVVGAGEAGVNRIESAKLLSNVISIRRLGFEKGRYMHHRKV